MAGDDNVRLAMSQQQLRQRESLFSISIAVAVVMYIVFVGFLFMATGNGLQTNHLVALGILAAMPASLMLGVLRFVFRKDSDGGTGSASDISPLLTIIQHIGEVIKDVLLAKKG